MGRPGRERSTSTPSAAPAHAEGRSTSSARRSSCRERDLGEAVALGDKLHLRAGVGDGDGTPSCLRVADRGGDTREEILLEDVGLGVPAGFRATM